jgi:hypothetical protein
LNIERVHDLYLSSNTVLEIKSKRLRWAGRVACMEESRDAHKILVGKLEDKGQLGK